MTNQRLHFELPGVATPCCGAGFVIPGRTSESPFCGSCLADTPITAYGWRLLPLMSTWRWQGREQRVLEVRRELSEAHREFRRMRAQHSWRIEPERGTRQDLPCRPAWLPASFAVLWLNVARIATELACRLV